MQWILIYREEEATELATVELDDDMFLVMTEKQPLEQGCFTASEWTVL